jgi:alpha-mannosidase
MADGILHIGPITGEISGQTGSGQWVGTGPLRWVYRWETEFHGQRVRQDIILDDGCRYLDFITRVYCGGANGFFSLVFDLPFSGALQVDVPFGVEPRNPDAEVYAQGLPLSYANIERHRRNQFWARSFASFSNERFGLSVITADGDKYWTYEGATRRLRHILFTPLDDDDTDWERWVTKARMALGWHEFRHRVVFHEGTWRQADICGESDRLRLPLTPVKPLGLAGEGGVAGVSQLAVSPDGVRLSAFHRDAAGYVLRLYESTGQPAEVTVNLPTAFAAATKTDFNLVPIGEDAQLAGDRLTLSLRPWEIATVLLQP